MGWPVATDPGRERSDPGAEQAGMVGRKMKGGARCVLRHLGGINNGYPQRKRKIVLRASLCRRLPAAIVTGASLFSTGDFGGLLFISD
jgi:hypothetical protein